MTSKKGILIIGATVQGLQAALTLGRLGRRVAIIDKNIDIASPPKSWSNKDKRWIHYLQTQISYHPLIELSTETEASSIRQNKEDVEVELTQWPKWVVPDLCVNCQKCLSSCPVDLSNGRKPLFELITPTTIAIDKREKAPCRLACPIGMNPQGYVALIGQGKFDEAYELILDKNPLPGICGRVCHHPCEKECRRQEIDEPVAICALKRFATDEARKKRKSHERADVANPNGPRVAVIGSGPAGLTAANDLARAGFRPIILEAEDKPGGLLWYGIAPYRLPREIVEEEIDQIVALGVDLRLRSPVRTWEDIERLKAEGFRAILLSTGASRDLRMNIKGEALENIHGCVSFLKGIWKGKIPKWLGKVAVIGGGNAAVEAARASIRAGAHSVTIVYRRTRKEMPADPHEVQQALDEGVKLRCLTAPVEFQGKDSKLARIKCIKMQLKGVDASGRPRPVPVKGSEFRITADTAIVSIGQEPDTSYGMDGDLRFGRRGTIKVGPNGETNIAGIYASGDVASGPSTVVEAMASGRRAAQSIIHAVNPPKDTIRDKGLEMPRKQYDPIPEGMPKQRRRPIPHREVFERIKDNNEVIGPFSIKEAMKEASRCLQCGVCSECLQCETACNLDAIGHERISTRRSFHCDQIIVADDAQLSPKLDSSRVIRIEHYGKRDSWTKATIAGRVAAMQALSKTHPVNVQPISRRTLSGGDLNIGIFLCSCNETLNENDLLGKMVAPLSSIQGVAHAEVLISACHPDKGRRIEDTIHKKGLNGALIASCVCCNVDFACESCTDQRIRLKNRLFIEGGYDPKDIAFVNIKETCLIPFMDDKEMATEHAMRIIRSGLWQLREQKTLPFISEQTYGQALILGATEAGIAAAKGLKEQFPSVVMVENQDMDKKIEEELRKWGISLLWPAKPIRLDGQRGNFTLILEKRKSLLAREEKKGQNIHFLTKGKQLRDLDGKIFDRDPRYQTIQADMIMLGRSEFKHIPHRRDDFERGVRACGRKAFGTLETAIPGVYMASWPQARNIPGQDLGKSAASEVLVRTYGKTEPSGYLVAHVDAEFCRGCGRCADICPEGAARLEETTRGVASSRIEPGLCTGCGSCIAECPTGAIRIPEYGQEYFEKVMNAFLG